MITHNSIGYSGRLGNQMFQYAALKAVSLETGIPCFLPNNVKIKLDGAFDFTNNRWIGYKLDIVDCFNITSPLIDNQPSEFIYQEKEFTFNPEVFNIQDNTAIEGYFQSHKYFEKHKDVILNEFTFKEHILNKCSEAVSKFKKKSKIS